MFAHISERNTYNTLCRYTYELLSNYENENGNLYIRGKKDDRLVAKSIVEGLARIKISAIKENAEWKNWRSKVPRYFYPDPILNNLWEVERIDALTSIPHENMIAAFLKNPENDNARLIWRYHDIVEGGWETEEHLLGELGKNIPKVLIITEGSSDTYVIKHALQILEPELEGLFEFIDMTENYPFTGTGNLFRFCQGIAKLRVSQSILVIFDNDTEGVTKYQDVLKVKLPKNIKPILLPNLTEANKFTTIGPNGKFKTNINGKAVSIEMFLDLKYRRTDKPVVRWYSYDPRLKQYQGSLENKEEYLKTFLKIKGMGSRYNFRKLKVLTSTIFEAYASIARQSYNEVEESQP